MLAQCLEFMVGRPEVEILVWVDNDDPELARYKAIAKDCKLKLSVRQRVGYKNFHVMVNTLAAKAKGDWLLLWNDDAVIKTQNWIELIEAHDAKQPVVLNFYNPTNVKDNLFPVISRPMLEAMGYYSMSTHCDSWVQDIANDLGIHIPVPGITALHTRDELHDDTKFETQAVYTHSSPEYDSLFMQTLRDQDKEKIKQWVINHSKQSV